MKTMQIQNFEIERIYRVNSDGEVRLYEGKEYNSDLNQYYYGARYYDPYKQIFTQPDSIIPNVYDPQQLNIYAFERGNPYKYVDPSGNIAVYFGLLGQVGLFVGGVASTGFVATYSVSNGLQVGTYTKGGFGGITTPTAGLAFEGGVAPFVNSLSEFEGSSYDLGFDVGEFATVGGGISLPRDKSGNINLKGLSVEGSFTPATDVNPPVAPFSAYAGISETKTKCIFGCTKESNTNPNFDKSIIKYKMFYKSQNNYCDLYNSKPYSTTQDPGPDGVIYAYGSRQVSKSDPKGT